MTRLLWTIAACALALARPAAAYASGSGTCAATAAAVSAGMGGPSSTANPGYTIATTAATYNGSSTVTVRLTGPGFIKASRRALRTAARANRQDRTHTSNECNG